VTPDQAAAAVADTLAIANPWIKNMHHLLLDGDVRQPWGPRA
jgi:hypothetical protein